jgi:hypothetical protein
MRQAAILRMKAEPLNRHWAVGSRADCKLQIEHFKFAGPSREPWGISWRPTGSLPCLGQLHVSAEVHLQSQAREHRSLDSAGAVGLFAVGGVNDLEMV